MYRLRIHVVTEDHLPFRRDCGAHPTSPVVASDRTVWIPPPRPSHLSGISGCSGHDDHVHFRVVLRGQFRHLPRFETSLVTTRRLSAARCLRMCLWSSLSRTIASVDMGCLLGQDRWVRAGGRAAARRCALWPTDTRGEGRLHGPASTTQPHRIHAQHQGPPGRAEVRPTASRTFAVNCGSVDSFQVSALCRTGPASTS
jgi:hypothetical protein